jgi:hypothetical protein
VRRISEHHRLIGSARDREADPRKAAAAALCFGHQQTELNRITAVVRKKSGSSHMVLGGIGMTECVDFLYESFAIPPARPADASH